MDLLQDTLITKIKTLLDKLIIIEDDHIQFTVDTIMESINKKTTNWPQANLQIKDTQIKDVENVCLKLNEIKNDTILFVTKIILNLIYAEDVEKEYKKQLSLIDSLNDY